MGTEDRGRLTLSALHEFHHFRRVAVVEWIEKPFVQDQQGYTLVTPSRLLVSAQGTRCSKLTQQVRQADIACGDQLPVGRHAERAGQIRFAAAGGAS